MQFHVLAWHYDRLLQPLFRLIADNHIVLASPQLNEVLYFADLGLRYGEASIDRVMKQGWTVAIGIFRKMHISNRAFQHIRLANLHENVAFDDGGRRLEKACGHYESAALLFESEGSQMYALEGAAFRVRAAALRLEYPHEDRKNQASKAIASLMKARTSFGQLSIIGVEQSMRRPEFTGLLIDPQKVRMSKRFADELLESNRRGRPTAAFAAWWVPHVLAGLDWKEGVAHRELGEFDEALACMTKAIEEAPSEMVELRAQIEIDKGYTYLARRGKQRGVTLALAAASFNNATKLCVQKDGMVPAKTVRTYVRSLIGVARTYLAVRSRKGVAKDTDKQLLPKMVTLLREAARLSRKNRFTELLRDALYWLGHVYQELDDDRRSYCAFALAGRVSDRIQRRCRTARLSRHVIGEEAKINDFLILMALNYYLDCRKSNPARKGHLPLERIFSYAERGRTRFLQSELSDYPTLPVGNRTIDLKELTAARRLWQTSELRLLEHESLDIPDEERAIKLQLQRDAIEARYQEILRDVRRKLNDPAYDPDQPVFTAQFSTFFREIRRHLRTTSGAVVEFHLSSSFLVVFVILPDTTVAQFIDVEVKEINDIAKHWGKGQAMLRTARNLSHWERGYLLQVLSRLHPVVEVAAQLVKEWEAKSGRTIEQITVIPHRHLHGLPLHAVPMRDGKPWGEACSIQYAPSASVLLRLLQSRNADVRKAWHPDYDPSVAASYAGSGDSPLLFCDEETTAVNRCLPGFLLHGEKASPDLVIQNARSAKYLHLACHGTFDNEHPLESVLALNPNGEAPPPMEGEDISELSARRRSNHQNGKLSLGDIFRELELPVARLVVLSACESGIAKIEEVHEEHLGFPAGFLYAGALAVISTLWRVDDVATWLLMRALTRELAEGAHPAPALRMAQQELKSLSRDQVLDEIRRAAAAEHDISRSSQMMAVIPRIRQLGPTPFAGPYWWAGFTINGLG